MSQKTSIIFFNKVPYLCRSLDQNSPAAFICFFIDFDYTVIIHYLCISHYLTILISFSCNYTAPSYCVIDSQFCLSALLPLCISALKNKNIMRCLDVRVCPSETAIEAPSSMICLLLEFILIMISNYSFICPCSCCFSIILISCYYLV